jgi:hypothetical protein
LGVRSHRWLHPCWRGRPTGQILDHREPDAGGSRLPRTVCERVGERWRDGAGSLPHLGCAVTPVVAPMLARAADGPDFGPSRTGRGRLAAAAHGLRARRRAMARRRGQLAAPWVCGHTGGCTHVGAGGRRARFWTMWEPPPSLRSHDPFRLENTCCSRVPTSPAVGTLAHLFSFFAPFLLRWAAPALACNLDEARCGAIRHRSCHSYDRRDGWCHCAALRVYLWLCPASRSARPIGCDQDAMYAHRHRTSSARRTSDARVEGQHGFTTGLNQATSHARRARRPDAAERRGLSSSHGRGVLLRIGLEEGSGCATHVSAAQSQERHVLQNFFWPSRWLPRWSNTAPRVRCRRICHVCSRGTPPTRAAMRGPMRRTLSSAADEFSDDLEMQT